MSQYEYTDHDGTRTIIRPSVEEPETVWLYLESGGQKVGALIPNADAPTVAAELLKAAGHEGVFVTKAYEEVEQIGDDISCGSGPETAFGRTSMNPNWLRNRAANCIALAEYIENKAQRETEAATKLQERRDAALQEMGIHDKYESLGLNAPMRKAIDRIIELEDGK